jgi:TRAP-type C4-dicarboxylate transport system substrate-binding protein
MKKSFLFVAMGFCLTAMLSPAAAVAQQKPIELSFAHTIPPVIPLAKVYEGWGKMVEEKTGGKVKIHFYWSESLLKASELFRGAQTGQSDISYYVVGLDYGLMPLNLFTKLAFLGFPNLPVGTEIYNRIYQKFPELRNEFKGVKVLSARMGPAYQLHFTKKAVRVPADLKGMKMISVGGSMAKEMVGMGAASLDVKVGDLYVSLERGLAEGISTHVPILHAFGILNLLPHHTMFPGGACMGPDMLLFNQKKWDSLPPDVRKVFEELSPWLANELIKADSGYEAMVLGKAREMGHTFTTPTAEELKLWREAVQPTHDKWIADTAAKGLPAKALYEEVQSLVKEALK